MGGVEWVVEAYGCERDGLASPARLRALFDLLIADLALRPVGEPRWHQFGARAASPGCACWPSRTWLATPFRKMDRCV